MYSTLMDYGVGIGRQDISHTRACLILSAQLFFSMLVFIVDLLLIGGAVGDQLEISLNGDSWSLSDTDGRVKAVKAQVPGSVHLDLM